MVVNRLEVLGTVSRSPAFSRSPAGIPHVEFQLEHQSQQLEAGYPRRAWFRITVIASGEQLTGHLHSLVGGQQVKVSGFISHHTTPNKIGKLVLHAEQIECIGNV